MHQVALVRYESEIESLKTAIELVDGFKGISGDSKVFIKPNFVFWLNGIPVPKFGSLTTARIIEDLVFLLCEYGVTDITLIEGVVKLTSQSDGLLRQAFKGMGFEKLSKKYGLKYLDTHESDFTDVELGDVKLAVNSDIFEADHVINLPVLKTHPNCITSLGIKNLKGLIDVESRKKCHNADHEKHLDYHISKLAKLISPTLTIIDGIYSLEYGPIFNGKAHRSDVIITSRDMISADKVGTTILGHPPETVPHIKLAAEETRRPVDLTDIKIMGDTAIEDATKLHQHKHNLSSNGEMPLAFEKLGLKGIRFPEADKTLCTYCIPFYIFLVMGFLYAPNPDQPFDNIEILSGKEMEPSEASNHTVLLGQCQVKQNRKNPVVKNSILIRGCPPRRDELIAAFQKIGVVLPENPNKWMDNIPSIFLKQYIGRPEFDERFYYVS